jgi:hypothetical protein
MKLWTGIIILAGVAALGLAKDATTAPATRSSFAYVDIKIDPHGKPLAAWQVEFIASDNSATLVGIEGGEGAYKEPPFYDPVALAQARVIVAAFSTSDQLPTKLTRVARLHLRFNKPNPTYNLRLITAADPEGAKMTDAKAFISEGAHP